MFYLVSWLPYIRINVHSSCFRVRSHCTTRGRHITFILNTTFYYSSVNLCLDLNENNYLINNIPAEFIVSVSTYLNIGEKQHISNDCQYSSTNDWLEEFSLPSVANRLLDHRDPDDIFLRRIPVESCLSYEFVIKY